MRRAGPHEAGAGRLRAGDVRQLGGGGDPGPAARAARRAAARGAARGCSRRAGSRAARASRARERARLARAAEQLVYAQLARDLLALNLKYGLGVGQTPRLDDADFVSTLVFDPSRGATTPKARFSYLFPSPRSAAIQVRLKPGLSDAERARATALVRRAVAMPDWRLHNAAGLHGDRCPRAGRGPGRRARGSVLRLLVVAVAVMALVLALVFRSRLRLLPLAVALGAVAVTFGLMALLARRSTMASIAVLPVLLGLGADYAIQYQARFAPGRPPPAALATIATAALATAAGFLVLLLSPVPMVRGFGLVLVAGIGVALLFAVAGVPAGLAAVRSRAPADDGVLARSQRGAAQLLAPLGRRVLGAGRRRRPGRRAGRGAPGLGACGWVADTQAKVESSLPALVPQDMPAVRDLNTLQRTTGVAGEVDVVVEGRNVTDPAVVAWMRRFEQRVLRDNRYAAGNGCGRAPLCPALSLPDLFRGDAAATRASIDALLAAVPPYFSEAVVTRDRRTANLAFGLRLAPLDEQQAVIERMRARLDPPPGVTARVAGLPVLAAEANAALAAPWRRLGTVAAGLLCVGLVLLCVWRSVARALVPLVPIALATGWSALVLFVLRIPLNPMSATLGALVLAITTEFAVLLAARFRAERAAGDGLGAALERTYRSTGAAVAASGATAIAGFAVLAASDVRMLQEFGIVCVVDLSVSLLGVLAVLPAVLVLAERRGARVAARASSPAVPA